MRRHELSDEQWARLRQVLPKQSHGPKSKRGDRKFINAVLYRAKTGVPWRDLPERFGPWKTVYTVNYGYAFASDIPDLEGSQEFFVLILKLF